MVTPSYKPAFVYGGPTRAVGDLCEILVNHGLTVQVYSTDANGKTNLSVQHETKYQVDGIPVYYFHRWTKDHSHFCPQLLWRVLLDIRKYDAIHLFSWWNLVTMPVMLICIVRRVRPVLSVHGTLSSFTFQHRNSRMKNFFHRLFGRFLLNHALLHVTTTKEQDEVKTIVPRALISLIPNFITLRSPLTPLAQKEDIFRLLFVGRLDAVKNLEFLIEVMKENWDIPIQLEIVGEGSRDYTESLHKKSAANKRIVWLGNIDGDEKWSRLASADLLVLPSRTENFGLVVLEALSQGTPVLVSDQVGLKQYLIDNQLGWVVKTDLMEWRKMLHSIWLNTNARNRIRLEAPGIVKAHFHPSSLVQQYVQMYQNVKNYRK